jgi:hypothetical protein
VEVEVGAGQPSPDLNGADMGMQLATGCQWQWTRFRGITRCHNPLVSDGLAVLLGPTTLINRHPFRAAANKAASAALSGHFTGSRSLTGFSRSRVMRTVHKKVERNDTIAHSVLPVCATSADHAR